MKRFYIITALLLCTAIKGLAYSEILARLVKADYGGKADSTINVLIEQFMNKQKGTFYSTPGDIEHSSTYIYWQQAHAMDPIIYGYTRHKDDDSGLASKYRNYMRLWYNNHANNYSGGSTGFENPFTDDMCWICLTLLKMSDATGLSTYANTAKKVFDNTIMKRAKEDEKGLWLPWNTDAGSGPNACTISPACLTAARLYNRYGTEKYLEYAEKFYTFMEKNIVKSDGRVEEPPLTYTQGTFGEACRELYHITGKAVYRTKAYTYINYAFTSGRCTNGQNILRHEGESMDQSIFKAVFIPYAVNFVLDEKMPISNRRSIAQYILKNADTLWGVLDKDAYPKMFCPFDWTKPYDSNKTASMGAMASGASLLENTARMCIGLTTKDEETSIDDILPTEPEHMTGVWTLDGRLVRTPWQGTGDLPSGLYIINNKKVLKR